MRMVWGAVFVVLLLVVSGTLLWSQGGSVIGSESPEATKSFWDFVEWDDGTTGHPYPSPMPTMTWQEEDALEAACFAADGQGGLRMRTYTEAVMICLFESGHQKYEWYGKP